MAEAKLNPPPRAENQEISAIPADRSPACIQSAHELELPGEISRAVGTGSKELALLFINQTVGTLPGPKDQSMLERMGMALPALQGIAPRDEIEGMLAIQIVALHNVAMDNLQRAALPEQHGEWQCRYVNNATKLTRAFAQALETLNRYRGKGQQKVTVEHVHVHPGGQAIVGAVEAPGGRGNRG